MEEKILGAFTTEAAEKLGGGLLIWGFVLGGLALIATTLSAVLLDRAAKAAQREASVAIAQLNERAEMEQNERVKLETRIAPRRLSPEQRSLIGAAFKQAMDGVEVTIVSYSNDVESSILARQLAEALEAAQVKVKDDITRFAPIGPFVVGIAVTGTNSQRFKTASAILTAAGLEKVVFDISPAEKPSPPFDGDVVVLVGAKPIE